MDRLLDELLAVWLGDAIEALLSYGGGHFDSWARAVALDEPTAERVALIIVRSIAAARRSGPRSLDDDGVSGAASDLVNTDLCAALFGVLWSRVRCGRVGFGRLRGGWGRGLGWRVR